MPKEIGYGLKISKAGTVYGNVPGKVEPNPLTPTNPNPKMSKNPKKRGPTTGPRVPLR